jgi:hypothetical protein
MEEEIGAMQSQAMEDLELPEDEGGKDPFLLPVKGARSCQSLILYFWPPEL